MGLLTREERRRLVDLLLKLPNIKLNPAVRILLIGNLPPELLQNISYSDLPSVHIDAIINTTDGPGAQRADGSWPIIWVIENAFAIDSESYYARDFQKLLDTLNVRASALPAGLTLEGIVNRAAGFSDVETWVERMSQIMQAVCLVEAPAPNGTKMGTGFLVGPDKVMTNYHVVKDVLSNPALRNRVILRFDHRTDSKGEPISQGKEYSLDAKQQILSSPDDESGLDFALLPVDGRPGDEEVQGRFGSGKRGRLMPLARPLQKDQPLFVIQHPAGAPLKVAVDTVIGVSHNRLRYRTNTKGGSSGSPCFNENWELVAIHHASEDRDDPTYNQGIPFSTILERADVRAALGL